METSQTQNHPTSVPLSSLSVDEELQSFVLKQESGLRELLDKFVLDGGRSQLPAAVRVNPVFRQNGYSGFEYFGEAGTYAKVGFAPLLAGGFVVHKLVIVPESRHEFFELFTSSGALLGQDQALNQSLLLVDLLNMEPQCPILSHLYNFLYSQYEQAKKGFIRSKEAYFAETFLRDLEVSSRIPLSVKAMSRDAALLAFTKKIIQEENDPVLTWAERQTVFQGLWADRAKVIRTKRRVHRLSWSTYQLPIAGEDLINWAHRMYLRTSSNIRGILYKYTIGVLIWFFATIRKNIGYSIALAIYGPFTFYFITQPLNPHAMWAVGKVRSGYLETISKLKYFDLDQLRRQPQAAPSTIPVPATAGVAGTVSSGNTTSSSPPMTGPSTVPVPVAPVVPVLHEELSKFSPSHMDFLLSTDASPVDQQNWPERMSNFKDMQIGYEANLQFAARMGRLEQVETQLNFPLIADSAWQEMERYIDQLHEVRTGLNQPDASVTQFLTQEEARARKMQLYIWDRLVRYILDHPYIVMDQGKEQAYTDYYFGHAFVLLRDMTLKLSEIHPQFKKPADFKRIEKLADSYQKSRIEGDSVLDRLKKNSALFSQKDRFDGREMRSYMQRQWEILYLLQNKAQEAANFGLQAYTWSVRNTVWLLQCFYSAKRREMAILFDRHSMSKQAANQEIQRSIEPLYEALFHLMNVEYVGLKPELSERLAKDIEFKQRMSVIETIEQSLREREKIAKQMVN